MFVFAGNLIWKMFDGLVRVHRTIKHIQFLFQDCKVSSIGTVLDMKDGVRMMFYLLDDTGVLDIEYSQYA